MKRTTNAGFAHCRLCFFRLFLQLTLELVVILFSTNTWIVIIKNQTYYFFDDTINIKNFDPNFLKVDKKLYKNIDIYYIGYITKKDSDYVNFDSVNSLYLIINEVDGYVEEINGNKYLTLVSTDKNKEVLTKYTKLWNGIKNSI